MQGGTRRKDSYTGHPLTFVWHKSSPRLTGYFPQYQKKKKKKKVRWISIQKQDLASAMGIMSRARNVDKYPQAQPHGNREREAENADQDVEVR